MPAWLGAFRKRSQSTKAPGGHNGLGTLLGGHGINLQIKILALRHQRAVLHRRAPEHPTLGPAKRWLWVEFLKLAGIPQCPCGLNLSTTGPSAPSLSIDPIRSA